MIIGTPGSELLAKCIVCGFFVDLDRVASKFALTVGTHFGPGAALLLSALLAFYVTLFGTRLLTSGGSQGDAARFLWTLVFSSSAMVILKNYALLDEWVFGPLENLALGYALELLALFGNGGKGFFDDVALVPGSAGFGYRELVALVEAQVIGVLEALVGIFNTGSWLDQGVLIRIGAVIAMLPYMFVAGIFSAFLLEAMFSYLAMFIVAPILVLGMPFPMGRAFATAGLRVLLGATLTIIFAAGAMGFTVAAVDKHTEVIKTIYGQKETAAEKRAKLCGPGADATAGGVGQETGADGGQSFACMKLKGNLDKYSGLQNKEFLLLFVMGFVSVLLHLKAKTLASNLSGANDGAGPAAAVVGGAQTLLGLGAVAATRLGFGRGGAATSLQAALDGAPGGRQLLDHGVVGGTAAAIVSRFRGTSGPATDNWNNAVGGAPFSAPPGGGGAGTADFAKMTKSIDNLTRVMQQMAPRLGSGS